MSLSFWVYETLIKYLNYKLLLGISEIEKIKESQGNLHDNLVFMILSA